VQGNFIGASIDGIDAVPNLAAGIQVSSANNVIGGTVAAARNLVSGNIQANILIQGANTTGNLLQGNFIGTNLLGTAGIGSEAPGAVPGISLLGQSGVAGPANNIIGGAAAGARNLISGNGGPGVNINNSTGTQVQGNLIGTTVAGTTALGNQAGVNITGTNNLIGGVAAGAGNVIAFNTLTGVSVAAGAGNAIRGNSIFSNGTLGIDLASDGVTPNDPGDADGGPNARQNFPVITGATRAGNNTVVTGSLNSTPLTQFVVEFFSSPACDPLGFGEGQTFLGSQGVTTDSAGNAAFTATLPVAVPIGQVITATATSAASNSSEFSQCAPVSDLSDLSITKTASTATVVTGTTIAYTITVANSGPGQALSVTVTDNLPPQTVFVSCSSTGGGVCGGTGNNRTVTFQALAAGSSAIITINARADCSTVDGTTIVNTATVTAATPDNNAANNTASVTVRGAPQAVLDRTSLDIGPVKAKFRPRGSNPPSDFFTLTNTGCAPSVLSAAQIIRTGSAVDSGNIDDPDDRQFFRVVAVTPQGDVPIPAPTPPGFSFTIPAGRQQQFRVEFNPVIPAIAGSNTGLSADQVLAARIDSLLTLTVNGTPLNVNLTGRVRTAPRVLDGLSLTRGSGAMTVTTPIWDADSNVNRIHYRFLSGAGSQVGPEIGVDVAQAIRSRNLVTGQSFRVIVDFTGDNQAVSRVQVTVFDEDGLNDIGATSSGGASPNSPQSASVMRGPVVRLKPIRVESAPPVRSRSPRKEKK
jgi:uncharacterized repeat protein (TIGR01451 family)